MDEPDDTEEPQPPAPVCRGCHLTLDGGPSGTYADCPECGGAELRAWPPVDDGPGDPGREAYARAFESSTLRGLLSIAEDDAVCTLRAARVLARRVRGGAEQAEVEAALAEVDWRSDLAPRAADVLRPDEREAVRRCCAAAADVVAHFEAVTRAAFGHRSGATGAMAYLRALIHDAALGDAANAARIAQHLAERLA